MTDFLRWESPIFPEKRSPWSRALGGVEFLRRHPRSAALGMAAAIGLAAAVGLGVGYLRYERLATADQAAALHAETANADLQDALARLRDQVGAADQALNAAQTRLASLSNEANQQLTVAEQATTSKTDRIGQLTHALEQVQRELHLAEAQRATLMARLSKAEADLAQGQARQTQAQAGLDQWQKKVQQLTADRDKAASERDQLRSRLGELVQKHSMLQTRPLAQAAPAPAAAMPPAALSPAAPAAVATTVPRPAAPAAVATVDRGRLAQFERVLASAGVDVRHLFAQYGVRAGEGGPFIPAPRGTHPDNTLSEGKLAALRNLVKALPVSAPLVSYEVSSPFGVRNDPFNGRRGFHTGIDLRAPYMSPVYATAPGVVTFSGYRDDYGKIVEIDHGHGISTRYAHLHRAIVSVGQQIAARQQIGFLGSSGRATGPHVHYEVLVNGEPQDPEKFLSLARLSPIAQR
jgi:murein DD-endopeptidase MepM/ murein hydrolase activator NlpD